MLFRDAPDAALAISQMTHAWISGQLLRAWATPLGEALLLATEQHDIGWLDWETAPSFDPATGRPHLFRAVGASIHAPMWTLGVERALGAWGTHVALLISRHGGVIYRRFTDRHRLAERDAQAAAAFLERQAPIEGAWARSLHLDPATLEHETALLAFADTLSLALCGELTTPLTLASPGQPEHMLEADGQGGFVLSHWPFRDGVITLQGQARALPPAGRLADEAAMTRWLAAPERVAFEIRLAPA